MANIHRFTKIEAHAHTCHKMNKQGLPRRGRTHAHSDPSSSHHSSPQAAGLIPGPSSEGSTEAEADLSLEAMPAIQVPGKGTRARSKPGGGTGRDAALP